MRRKLNVPTPGYKNTAVYDDHLSVHVVTDTLFPDVEFPRPVRRVICVNPYRLPQGQGVFNLLLGPGDRLVDVVVKEETHGKDILCT